MLKNKATWFGLILLATTYLLLGYFAGPRLMRPKLEQYVSTHLGRELRFENLRVDPLTWSVRLDAVDLVAGEQSLWPGLAMSAARVDLHFSLWGGLSPVISRLALQAPRLLLDGTDEQSQTGRYPFISLWQQWRENVKAEAEQGPIPIKSWQVDAGQILIVRAGFSAVGTVLLDNVILQADLQEPDDSYKFSLAFAGTGNVDVESQGVFRSETLGATGQYQLKSQPGTDGSAAELEVAGRFSSDLLADAIRIYLTESQLHSDRFSTCMLNGLLCAVVTPLDVGFASSVLAASDGVRISQANARLNAFKLDASLGQGRLAFADRQDFTGGQIQLVLPLAVSPDSADQGTGRNFVMQLNDTDTTQYQINGQLDMASHAVDARFEVDGRHDITGSTQLRRISGPPAQATYSRLDLHLENPAASLAQEFIDENFTARLASSALQLQLAVVKLDDLGLRLQEKVILEQTALTPASSSALSPGSRATLDAEWLLALLQDPDNRIELDLAEQTIDSTTSVSLSEMVRQQTLSTLTELAEQPFIGLANALNISNQDLHEIRFASGSAALGDASTRTIADLAGILIQRPRLAIAVAGVYDPLIDKKALQIEQVRTHVALAMAADLAFRTGAEPPDFTDPIVHSVIDEFARQRLPSDVLQGFVDQFGYADADQGVLPEGDVAAYYSNLFELLVAHSEIPQGAMTTLARYRAQAIIDGLEDAGVGRDRLETVTPAAPSGETRADGIPLPLHLKVWSGENAYSAGETIPVSLPEVDLDTDP